MTQETLEEVSERYANMQEDVSETIGKYLVKAVFKDGAYWNQKRSYSEEEVLEILVKAIKDVKVKQLTFYDGGSEYPIYSNLSKWFEQFKKK